MAGRRKSQPYAQVAITLPWHRKVCAIPPADAPGAVGLYVASVCFCQQHRTDGIILKTQVPALMPTTNRVRNRLVSCLVSVELWLANGDRYEIHDYLEHNKSRAEIEELSVVRAASGAARAEKGEQVAEQVAEQDDATLLLPATDALTATATDAFKDKPLSPCERLENIHPAALGKLEEKLGSKATSAQLDSLRSLCKQFPSETLCVAISQAFVQINEGSSPYPDNLFGFVASIAKGER